MRKIVATVMMTIFIISILAIKSNASNEIQVTKSIVNDNRSINLNLTNIPVLEEGCKWGITKEKDSTTIKKWYDITDYDETNKTLKITLNVVDEEIQDIVKVTDSIYLYIKNENDELKVKDLNINIKLSLTEAFTLDKTIFYDVNVPENIAYNISALYNIEKQYYVLEKVTDENIINQYNKDNAIEKFETIIDENKIPKDGWIEAKESVFQMDAPSIKGIPNSILKSEAGIYYVWIKAEDEQSKTVYGVGIIKIGEIQQDNQQGENENNNDTKNEQDKDVTDEKPNESDNKKQETNEKKDDTIADKAIPQTGENYIIGGMILIIIATGLIFFIKSKKYKI